MATTFGVLDVVSHVVTVPSFGPELAALVGLGVGIDYALFVVTRYRSALRAGRRRRQETPSGLTHGWWWTWSRQVQRRPWLAGGTALAAVLTVIPRTSPQDAATSALVQRLRTVVVPHATAHTGVRVLIGGQTAASIDTSGVISRRPAVVVAFVIALSVLLLMAAFRSVIVPLVSAGLTLVSTAAAYGVIVAVFQWGWLGRGIGNGATAPVDPWIPLMLFALLFGFSMDYQVFLVSRIREEWLAGAGDSDAVADGLAATGRVITSAAAIMICVFAAFVLGDLRVLRVIGLGMAVAVFLDATLVRMVAMPAVLRLAGRANWWFPRWLDRAVPPFLAEVRAAPGPRASEPGPAVSR